MKDLTLPAFAYLRTPLLIAAIAFAAGTLGLILFRGEMRILAVALMMVLFTQAARLALVTFDCPARSSSTTSTTPSRASSSMPILEDCCSTGA
jgi:hypothetical protein